MADTLVISIIAKDGSVAVFRKVTDGAQKMGDEIDKAGEKGAKGFQKIGDSAGKIGAGIGTAVSALSLLGQAFISQERQIDQLERQYGSASGQILQFTERIQDSTRFSNDAARSAASISAGLASQYGLSIDQIEQLITRSADLAQTSGLSLEDVVQRTSSALRGEAESAEALGLSLNDANVARYAAAEGITNYSSGLDEAGRAQVRLNLFLEQSAFATGAAGDAAQTAGGQTQQFVNNMQDLAQSAGGVIGPVGQIAAQLAPLALLGPVVGAGLGKAATGVKAFGVAAAAARVGSVGLLGILGPVGIIAAAGLAAFALYEYATATSEMEQSQADAAVTVESLTVMIRDQAAAGMDTTWLQAQTTALAELTGQRERAEAAAAASRQRFNDVGNTEPGRIPELQAEFDGLTASIDRYTLSGEQLGAVTANTNTILQYQGDNVENVRSQFEEARYEYQSGRIDADAYAARLVYLSANLDNVGISAADVAAEQSELNAKLSAGTTILDAYAASYARYFEAQKPQGQTQVEIIEAEIAASARRAQQFDDSGETERARDERRLQAHLQEELAAAKATESQEALRAAVTSVAEAAISGFGAATEAQSRFTRQGVEELDAYLQKQREVEEARRDSIESVKESYQSALGQNSFDTPFLEGLDAMVATKEISQEAATAIDAAFDQLAASGASALEVTIALADSMGYAGTEAIGFAAGLYGAVDATDGVLGLYGAIDNLGSKLSEAKGIADELFGEGGDPFDGLGPLAEMLANGTISQEQFNEAVAAGTQIQADNARGQESLNAIRANLLPLLAEQTTALADYYGRLEGLNDEEQQRALYLGDSANQQKLLNIQQLVYANSIGQLPDDVTTDLLVNAASADPVLAGILEDMDLISIGANGEITVTLPNGEATTATLTTINDTLEILGSLLADIAGVPDPFAKTASGADAATISTDGLTASTRALWAALGAPIPPPPGGGVGQNPREGIGFTDPNGGTGDAVRPGQTLPPFPAAVPTTAAFPAAVPGAGVGPQTTQTVTIDYIANTDSAIASVSGLNVLTTGLTDGAHYVVVDSDVANAQSDLAGIQGEVRVLDESGATVYVGADDAQAVRAMTDVEGQIRIIDEATGTVYVYGDVADAEASMIGISERHKAVDGQRSTLFADGDNSSALARAAEAGGAFDGINGKSALLFANGDSSGAANAAGAAAAAIYGVDGTTGTVYVSGIDNYSGVVQQARNIGGSVIATAFVDVVTRSYKQGFANGGIVPYAAGGVIPAAANGRVVRVGENGPENALLPGGTLITPAPASRNTSGRSSDGATYQFNLYGTYVGVEDFAGAMFDALGMAIDMETASQGGR